MEEYKTVKQKIEYSYDALHRLIRVQCGDEAPIQYAYDPAGNLVATGIEVEPAPAKAKVATLQAEVEQAVGDEAVEEGAVPEEGAVEKEVAKEAAAGTSQRKWHVSRNGEQYGPFTWEELRGFAQDGRVRKDDFLWQPGMPEWVKADNREGLF